MATTQRGKQLTEEHRQYQVLVAENAASQVRTLFLRLIDWGNVADSARGFGEEAAKLVARNRILSRNASIEYLEAFRQAESPASAAPVEAPEDATLIDLTKELVVTARVSLLKLAKKGYSREDALRFAGQTVAAKATKLVADGGRRVIENEVRHGKGPIGYARVPDADPCAFCAMLASRGVYYAGREAQGAQLYRSDSFKESNDRFVGDGQFKVHDGCCCTLEPVYMRDGKIDLPGNGNQLAREWAEVAAGQPDPWGAWRRWRDSKTLPENYVGDLEGVRRPAPGKKQHEQREKQISKVKAAEKLRFKTPQDYADYADELEKRINGIDEEIAQLKARGQGDNDIPVMVLSEKRRMLLSHIDRYRAKSRML